MVSQINFGKLEESVFLSRPNRFLLICELISTGEQVEVHLPDPGRLKELLFPGTRVWLRYIDRPGRRTKWSAVICAEPQTGTLISLQSILVNELVKQALLQGELPELAGWKYVRSEFPLENSRWDFLLENANSEQLLLEVKSVTLVNERVALFPDAVTARGRKHMLELARLQKSGQWKTAVLFVVQREDADVFGTAAHIDPAFAEAFIEAQQAGVMIGVRQCQLNLNSITLNEPLSIKVD